MNTPKICPSCGNLMPVNSPHGLCPACLLKAGMPDDVSEGAASSMRRFVPPTVEDLKESFPQLEILSLIGRGGMGAVYKARQPALDRTVALKILAPPIAGDPAFEERFSREARALAKLAHPHIVGVHDFGVSGNFHYLLMEYVDGVSVREALDAGRMSAGEALAIVPQLCDALQFAHDQGIVHRDIKPENILLDGEGRVKIADFGLAKIVGATAEVGGITGRHDIMGTPHYMAPEQIEHPESVDHRADIYSLGVVFYQMLTGELPLGRFWPPSRKVDIDVRLDEVVLRTLEKEPGLRYQQARMVKHEVETIASSKSAQKKAPTNIPVAAPHAVNPVSAPAIALMLIFGLSLVVSASLLLFFAPLGISYPNVMPGRSVWMDGGLNRVVPSVFMLLSVVLNGFGVWGAWEMYRMRRFWVAFGACMVAIVAPVLSFPPFFMLPIGIWALVALFRNDVRERFSEGSSAPMSSARIPSPPISGFAVAGAVWAGVFLLLAWIHLAVEGVPELAAQSWRSLGFGIVTLTFLAVPLSAPIGTTVLGMAAIRKIQESEGRISGLRLAVFDVVLFPLLIVDAAIVLIGLGVLRAGTMMMLPFTRGWLPFTFVAIIVLAGVCVFVDWRIIRLVWERVTQSQQTGLRQPAGTS